MSIIRINASNIDIYNDDILNLVVKKKRYSDINHNVLKNIVLEVISAYKNTVSFDKEKSTLLDDEVLFDEIYDYMLKRLDEMFSTSDIAYMVDDVLCQIEDIVFDKGLLEYIC